MVSDINKAPKDDGIKWSSEVYDISIEAEKKLLKFFTDILELKEFTEEDEIKNVQFPDFMIRKTTQEEDENKRGDFSLYRPDTGEYVHFDLTTTRTPEVREYKDKNAQKNKLKVLNLRKKNIELALMGCDIDRDIIKREIRRQVLGIEASV